VAGLYTALSGPGGASYYDPLTGVGMARDKADSANEYSDNLNSIEPALHKAFVDVTGLLPGPLGAVGSGLVDGEITYIETGNAKTSLVRGGTTAAVGLAFGKAGGIIGGAASRYVAGRLSSEAAPVIAGAISREATSGVGPGGARMQRGFAMIGTGGGGKGFNSNERAIADYLRALGRTVSRNPLEGTQGAGRQGDAYVDGLLHEFKTLDPGATEGTIKNTVNNSIRRGGQARNIVIDARGSGLSRDNAQSGLYKALGITRGRVDHITVIGDGFLIGGRPR